jgi:hypothetical protein
VSSPLIPNAIGAAAVVLVFGVAADADPALSDMAPILTTAAMPTAAPVQLRPAAGGGRLTAGSAAPDFAVRLDFLWKIMSIPFYAFDTSLCH